jgi:hypothetical protein
MIAQTVGCFLQLIQYGWKAIAKFRNAPVVVALRSTCRKGKSNRAEDRGKPDFDPPIKTENFAILHWDRENRTVEGHTRRFD